MSTSAAVSPAAAAAVKKEFLVILPDQTGALERRMNVRPQHLSNLKPRVDSSFFVFGGAMLEDHPAPGEGPKIKGSVMLALAHSKEEVMEALKEDVYTKENVWDWEKVQIIPFISAVRKGLESKV